MMNLFTLLRQQEGASISSIPVSSMFLWHAGGKLDRQTVIRAMSAVFVATAGNVEVQRVPGGASLLSASALAHESMVSVASLASFVGEELFFYGPSLPAPLLTAPVNSPGGPTDPSYWCVGADQTTLTLSLTEGGVPLVLGIGGGAFAPALLVRNFDRVKVKYDATSPAASKNMFILDFLLGNTMLERNLITDAQYKAVFID